MYTNIDSEKAIEYYKQALNKDSKLAAAYGGIGSIYANKNYHEGAIKMYEAALQYSPWSQMYSSNLAYQYLKIKHYQKAIDINNGILKLDYRFLPPYYDLSKAYLLRGELEEAYSNQKYFVELFEDEQVTSLKRNQTQWYYTIDDDQVYLNEYPEKKSFAYYTMALIAYLNSESRECKEYIKKARSLGLSRELESEVKRLVRFDIQDISEEQEDLRVQLAGFNASYLK